MPNSQVSCNPSPPTKPYFWTYEEYMRPSGMTFWTLVSCIITCVVLAISSFAFGYRERKNDKQEMEENDQIIRL